jgi:O-antigen/teichoic acid export membrane protein
MGEQQSSYRQIMKATSIFGGVQVLNILIQLIRSKVIAVLLGPAGIGIMGLLQTSIIMMVYGTNFGLGTSAVRDISEAGTAKDSERLAQTVGVFRKLVWITGLLGMGVTIALSPLLSRVTFGNYDYTLGFVVLAVTVLLTQLSAGQLVLLQGLRKTVWLAKATLYGSVFGLLCSVPMYYFFGNDGIIPAMVLTALTLYGVQYWFANKIEIHRSGVSLKGALVQGKTMMKLGFILSVSALITVAASYLIRIFIGHTGGIEQVGLYNAGFAIIGTYVGLVFAAMATDYYPRLSAVAHSNEKSSTVINHQAELALLILGPIIMVFLVFIKWLIVVLYSEQFIPVNDMILYAALGMFFKSASWAIGFIFLAKGASRLFFWNELVYSFYTLGLNMAGYYLLGLTGMGISFLVAYLLYLIQVYFVARHRYGFSFSSDFVKIFVIQVLLAVLCLIAVKSTEGAWPYILGGVLIMASTYHAYRELDKRLSLEPLLASLFGRLKR